MRTSLQVLSFGCLVAVSVSGWSTPATADAAGVRDAENRWSEAFVSGDTATLDALLDAAYVSVNSNGHARPKAEVLAISAQYAAAHPGGHAEPLASTSTIRVIGNAAVVRHHGATDASVDVFHFSGGQLHAWYSQHSKLDG